MRTKLEISTILAARQDTYGDFQHVASTAQALKNVLVQGVAYGRASMEQREAIDMIASKLSRIVNGNPDYKDSWTDIIGYARLVERDLSEPTADK